MTSDSFAVVGDQRRRRLLDARPLRVREPSALEGDAGVFVLTEVDERIAIRQPGAMVLRQSFPAPAALRSRACAARPSRR